jgi:hypothetical protein
MSEELTYEAEQERLKAEYDGQVTITAPRDPEVNPEVYKDVEPLLYRGFLTVPAVINDVYFVFKSLNQHEYELLRFSGGVQSNQVTDRFWDMFLAYGVFMVDGTNILTERERWLPRIAETFSGLNKEAKAKIIRYLSEINRRSAAATALTEAYSMELNSRYRWAQLRGLDLTSVAVTGIDGSQKLGLNWAQQLWRALNYFEDHHAEHERAWENAKFIGSCMAGKGISKVYNQDTDRRAKEKQERMDRKDRILREILLGEKVDTEESKIPGAVVKAARTVEELASQLQEDLRGNKDWHDRVIEEHERRVQQTFADHRTQLETLARENVLQHGDRPVFGGSDLQENLQGLTAQQVEEHMRRRQQLEAQAAARAQVRPMLDEKTERFLERWGGNEVSSEVSTTDKDISGAIPVPTVTRTPVAPFRKK